MISRKMKYYVYGDKEKSKKQKKERKKFTYVHDLRVLE